VPGARKSLVALAGVALLITARMAEPCSCARAPDVREAADAAQAVFVGEVTRFERLEPWWSYARRYALTWFYEVTDRDFPEWFWTELEDYWNGPEYGYRALLEVEHGWKNVTTGQAQVYTGMWEGDCGFPFKVGQRYLVYADPDHLGRGLYTSTCTRTVELGHPGTGADIPVLESWKRGWTNTP